MEKLSGNKKIIISIAGFVLVMVLLVVGLSFLGGKDKGPDTELSSESGNISYENPDENNEGTTASDTPDYSGLFEKIDINEGRQIEAYISGKYYISATMYADDAATDMDIAISGSDFHTTMDMDGIKMGIMFRGDKIYMINSNEKKYLDFDSLAALTGSEMDFDVASLKEVTAVLDLSTYNFQGFEQSKVDFEGQTANCYRYYADELSIFFYFVNGELKQVDYGDADGNVATSIDVKAFSPEIPSDMLTLIGLRQSTIFDFFGAELMQQIQ